MCIYSITITPTQCFNSDLQEKNTEARKRGGYYKQSFSVTTTSLYFVQSYQRGFLPLTKQHGSVDLTAGRAEGQWLSADVRILTGRRKEDQEHQTVV